MGGPHITQQRISNSSDIAEVISGFTLKLAGRSPTLQLCYHYILQPQHDCSLVIS